MTRKIATRRIRALSPLAERLEQKHLAKLRAIPNAWHWVTERDQKRISCMVCEGAGLPKPAEVCEHATWNTGNTCGVSFWYYCLAHGVERGFTHHKTKRVAV